MSIQEQLQRDIALVKEGVVVTEADLADARIAIDERAEARRLTRRRVTTTVAAVAAAVIVGVGVTQTLGRDDPSSAPAAPNPTVSDPYAKFLRGSPPTPDLIAGFWRVDNAGLSVLFGDDGTVQFDDSGQLFSDPQRTATYSIDGSQVTISWDGDTICGEPSFPVTASIPKPGSMHLVQTASSECSPFGAGQSVLEHVLPTSKGLASLVFSSSPGWEPLSDARALAGDWLAEGGGFVLEMSPDGGYLVLDETAAPVDRGRWSLRGSDLTLTSSSRSTACDEGDVLLWGAMEHADPGTATLRGTLEQNTCRGRWTPKAWFLIPNSGD